MARLIIEWNEKETGRKAEELKKSLEYHLNRVLAKYKIIEEEKVIKAKKIIKSMEKDAKEITEQEPNPEDLIPETLDATPNLEETK